MNQVQISEVVRMLRLPAHFINTRAEFANCIEARIAELEKPYAGMTDAEIDSLYAGLDLDNVNKDRFYVERSIEAETIKRYNEQRSVK